MKIAVDKIKDTNSLSFKFISIFFERISATKGKKKTEKILFLIYMLITTNKEKHLNFLWKFKTFLFLILINKRNYYSLINY